MRTDWFEKLSRDLVDRGLLIEAGWQSMLATVVAKDAPAVQKEEMRDAFFAGAQHLFASIMSMLEEGAEATEADLARMSQISDELDAFIADYKRKHHMVEH